MPATDEHSRRVGDLIRIVQGIVDEVDDYIRGGGRGGQSRKVELMKAQAAAMDALTRAMAGQHELLDQLKTTREPMPARRATDVPAGGKREQPNLRAVEDIELDEIRRRAGIE